MSFSYYGELCTEVYDLTKKIGQSINGDIEYYRDRLLGCQGRILEAMAGSGRVLIPLLEAGLLADGVDASPDMLASCRRRCADRGLAPELYLSSLQELALPERYEAILVPAGSFLLIERREESLQALRRLYDHLLPGGRLMLDLFLPDADFAPGGFAGSSAFPLPDGDTITMEGKLAEADLFGQYKVSYIKYEKWRQGKLVATELQRFALRWYGVEEFKLVLESLGFADVTVCADFEPGKAPSNAGQQYVYEAVRR
ncbi:class I SAM-dependent methyltransferase [Paenibacillus sp. MWE-103]|uniref:Class I SAM-dependent methyltransferase n=1 Tax=Paenibacillus artemisiicola TaxID=1172618 RepID=A0ABS3WJY9_9BACL|nr:class I SAM-dependent methyltransferase [Paenibacillus artemisiicola]MBO7748558.1 class I SAM-dependent methyltransferase [Paenibacillus artemisiicola]